jgi:hypothetical protein
MEEYLEECALVGYRGSVIKLSSKGDRWLNKAKNNVSLPALTITPSSTMLALEKPSRPQPQMPR